MERRTLCAVLLALLLLALCPAALAEGSWADADNYDISWYSDTETVFHINTPAQLAGLMKLIEAPKSFAGQTVYLDADLDMGAHEWFCQTDQPFMGTFDGLGHTISGLHMNGTHERMGLFGQLKGATVQNLSIVNASFTSTARGGYFGLLAAWAAFDGNPPLIRNCTTSGSITANKTGTYAYQCRVGGLVGNADGLTVQACASDAELKCDSGSITGGHNGDYMGGIIGYSDRAVATVEDCLFSGTIESWNNGSFANISGMVGLDSRYNVVTVRNCLMLGLMRGTPVGEGNISFSRIAATDDSRITSCYYVKRDGEGGSGTGIHWNDNKSKGTVTEKELSEIKEQNFLDTLNGMVFSGVVWAAGKDGIPTPVHLLADYSKVDAAIEEANALKPESYTNFSGVEAAIKAVVRGKKIGEQAAVDAMAQAILDAIAALVRIPTLPQTGDTSRLSLWGALTLASLLALAALTGRKGKKPLSQPR